VTLFSVARPVALKVPQARALPILFRPNCCNRVITHERDWWSVPASSCARPNASGP
jgi:hypothetical protein